MVCFLLFLSVFKPLKISLKIGCSPALKQINLQSWTKVVETNKYHAFFANVLAYKRVNNIYPRSPRSMLFPGVCKFTRLCFDHVTTLTTLKWGRGVENISYGTLNKWKFGKVSQEFCPRLSEERNV